MNRYLLAACLLTATSAFALDDTETTRKSFGSPGLVEIHNVNGLIRVTASNTRTIQLVATRTIHADDQSALNDARSEVKLDIQESGGNLRVCVMHYWDDCKGNKIRSGRPRDPGYRARYDLELQVPASTEIDLHAINGPVEVTGIHAPFRVQTVNGQVRLEEMNGTGRIQAVNGRIKLSFAEAPTSAISVKTVNGEIEAAFPKSLNAAMRFKTFRGEVFTDFATTLPAGTTMRPNREFTVNIGSGGPTHSFETLNGRIQIAQR
jgi:hypothetical protein